MRTVFDSYSDPGHGWVKVPRSLLKELGIEAQITPYSYQRGDDVFLEEDCDLSTFMRAMEARGVTPKFRHHSADKSSRIRKYNRYGSES